MNIKIAIKIQLTGCYNKRIPKSALRPVEFNFIIDPAFSFVGISA